MNNEQYFQLLLKNDCTIQAETFLGGVWRPLANSPAAEHRTLCCNEFVFEIDSVPADVDNWPAVRALAEKLEKRFTSLNIPFLRFSSGRNMHYHVFFEHTSGLPDNEVYDIILRDYFKISRNGNREITMAENLELMRLIKNGIYELIIEGVKQDGAEFDPAPTKARSHMIRIEGGQNQKTKFYKSLLPNGLSQEQSKILEDKVVFPETIPLWNMPPDFFVVGYQKFVKRKAQNHVFKRGTPGKIGWIEQLLQKPQADGRKRIIDLLIAPYLVNIKQLPEKEAFALLWEWTEKSNELRRAVPLSDIERSAKSKARRAPITQPYVISKIAYVKSCGLKPLRYDNLHIHGLEFLEKQKLV